MKVCFKFGKAKDLSEFYPHKRMRDGHLNKCKDCTRSDVLSHRDRNLDRIRAYDRSRGSRQSAEDGRLYRRLNPEKAAAHRAVARAIATKKLVKGPCEICGRTDLVHGHHDDYSVRLGVRWLCPEHHKAQHVVRSSARR